MVGGVGFSGRGITHLPKQENTPESRKSTHTLDKGEESGTSREKQSRTEGDQALQAKGVLKPIARCSLR